MTFTIHNRAKRSILNVFLEIMMLCGGMALPVLIYMLLACYASLHKNSHGDTNDGNTSSSKGGHGLSKSDIQKIPTVVCNNTHKNGDGDDEKKDCDELCSSGDLECTVCLEQFKDGDKYLLMPSCRHCFHLECTDAWISKNAICPVCRCNALPKHEEHQEQEPNNSDHIPESIAIDMPS
ncbi:RING-H2 finger protein ATL39-like [Cryptomeria japonica]|uniref:RING-H2 finger protein ATL39-like n=1 Tax=Cryptomeria japonica TaxID=3369 RepID=UPI0027DA68A8|nr:RING-H2 finger protein ATL39-like [Cryptomeria japonica]